MNGVKCSITLCPFVLCISELPCKSIPRPPSPAEPIDPSGNWAAGSGSRLPVFGSGLLVPHEQNNGTVHLGTYEYRFGYCYRGQTMEITFDLIHLAFVCQPEGALAPIVVPARGLTKADLMCDLAWMLALPAFQLAFPFSPEEQRRLALVNCLSGTTF